MGVIPDAPEAAQRLLSSLGDLEALGALVRGVKADGLSPRRRGPEGVADGADAGHKGGAAVEEDRGLEARLTISDLVVEAPLAQVDLGDEPRCGQITSEV